MGIEDIFRAEHGRILATLIRRLGDFDVAEEALQEAFAAALEQWPGEGTPAEPGGVAGLHRPAQGHRSAAPALPARRRAGRDRASHGADGRRGHARGRGQAPPDLHVLPPRPRARGAGGAHAAHARGLATEEIARAFLVPPRPWPSGSCGPRAKIRAARIPYEVPPKRRARRAARGGDARGLSRVQRGLRGELRARARARTSCASRPSGSGACWSSCCPTTRRRRGCSPSCCCTIHGGHPPRRPATSCCSRIRTGAAGIAADRGGRGCVEAALRGRPAVGAVCAAGRHRGRARAGAQCRRHRLAADRRPLRRARRCTLRPWSSSTGRSRSRCRERSSCGLLSWRSSTAGPSWTGTICCPWRGRSCCAGSAATRRPLQSYERALDPGDQRGGAAASGTAAERNRVLARGPLRPAPRGRFRPPRAAPPIIRPKTTIWGLV